jgi:hypothetical protein
VQIVKIRLDQTEANFGFKNASNQAAVNGFGFLIEIKIIRQILLK